MIPPTDRPKRLRPIGVISLILLMGILLFYCLIPLPEFRSNWSTVVDDHKGNLLRAFLNSEEQWQFPPEPSYHVPRRLLASILVYEDRRFPFHHGVDLRAILRASFSNLRQKRVVSGASTISMQVIRIAGGRPRTFFNKLLEICQAVKLELSWSKKKIFHWYLNHAPYGGNIIGIQAAARRYFGKPPSELSWSEAAILAVLPNSPGMVSPTLNREKLRRKRNRLLKHLFLAGMINATTLDLAVHEPISARTHSFQMAAPHWAQRFHGNPAFRGRRIRTALDLDTQRKVAGNVQAHMHTLRRSGIRHASVVVLDTATGAIRAYVGSPDFFDSKSSGQVDGADASRSTGSILKPFLYALAMDAGLILPPTWIRDVPTFYGAFSPSNADRAYHGLVTAREALIRSLNVPAVRLLNAFGTDRFYRFLEKASISTLFRTPDEYGLTLILGGGEATLLELAALYRGLANNGHFPPPRQLEAPSFVSSPNLISPEASYLTMEIMKSLKRPGAEYFWEQFSSPRPVAWKTGTSFGQRDGWAIGITPDWTIAVWTGNFDGEGNPRLTGAGSAAPLMFRIFSTLPAPSGNKWFSRRNLSFRRVLLCRDSGFTAGPNCPHTVEAEAPERARPLPPCPYHRSLFVTPDEKYQVCSRCWTPGEYKQVRRLVLPPDVSQFMRNRGIDFIGIPLHKPECPTIPMDHSLWITYPEKGARIMIPRDFQGRWQKVTITAAHRNRNTRVFWYVDGAYRGVTHGLHKLPLLLDTGKHRITAVDEAGSQASRILYVVRSGA